MSVRVYGINHLAIEVDDVAKAVAFYEDVFQLEKMDEGEGDSFSKSASFNSSLFSRWKNYNLTEPDISVSSCAMKRSSTRYGRS